MKGSFMETTKTNFDKLDYGTRVSNSEFTEVKIVLDNSVIMDQFAIAYVNELKRMNPVRYQADPITVDDLKEYFSGILALRVEMINNNCPNLRQARRLYIPTWIEYTISKLGIVTDRVNGLVFKPTININYDITNLLNTSDKLSLYQNDGLHLQSDAFPRSWEGDENVMGMVIIGDYIQGRNHNSHPVHSYVSAFLGNKLVEEQTFSMLFRVRYDETQFILQQLIHDKSLL